MREHLLADLIADSDRMILTFHEPLSRGESFVTPLVDWSSDICRARKRFLVHLIGCRLLDLGFVRSDANVEKYYPRFAERARGNPKGLGPTFTAQVRGKIWERGEKAMGPTKMPRDFVSFPYGRKTNSYKILCARLLVKIRV